MSIRTPKYPRVFYAKAVVLKWRHFGFDGRWNFAPEFGLALVSSCLVHVMQWRNVHLCSGFEKKWQYFGLKVKKLETDFTAVLVYS